MAERPANRRLGGVSSRSARYVVGADGALSRVVLVVGGDGVSRPAVAGVQVQRLPTRKRAKRKPSKSAQRWAWRDQYVPLERVAGGEASSWLEAWDVPTDLHGFGVKDAKRHAHKSDTNGRGYDIERGGPEAVVSLAGGAPVIVDAELFLRLRDPHRQPGAPSLYAAWRDAEERAQADALAERERRAAEERLASSLRAERQQREQARYQARKADRTSAQTGARIEQ
jgi:hypothetical protein